MCLCILLFFCYCYRNIVNNIASIYNTKIDTFVCPPHISETVAVRIMKLAHRPRIALTTNKLISNHILLSILSIIFYTNLTNRDTSTPNIAHINMDNLLLLPDRSLCIIVFSMLIRMRYGLVVKSLTGDRVVTSSNHSEAVWKLFLLQFTLPPLNFANVFRKRLYRSCNVQLSAMC